MFLKELYRHSKVAGIAVCIFLFTYIFLNIKWGIVAAPVFQYGMYSSPQHLKDTQVIYLVTFNTERVNFAALSYPQTDMLQLSLLYYEKQKDVNETVYQTMHRFLGFTGLMDHGKYTNHLSDQEFNLWFLKKLENILGYAGEGEFVRIQKQKVIWKYDTFLPAAAPIIYFIEP